MRLGGIFSAFSRFIKIAWWVCWRGDTCDWEMECRRAYDDLSAVFGALEAHLFSYLRAEPSQNCSELRNFSRRLECLTRNGWRGGEILNLRPRINCQNANLKNIQNEIIRYVHIYALLFIEIRFFFNVKFGSLAKK